MYTYIYTCIHTHRHIFIYNRPNGFSTPAMISSQVCSILSWIRAHAGPHRHVLRKVRQSFGRDRALHFGGRQRSLVLRLHVLPHGPGTQIRRHPHGDNQHLRLNPRLRVSCGRWRDNKRQCEISEAKYSHELISNSLSNICASKFFTSLTENKFIHNKA